jgi:hypothetical protein
MKILSSGYYYAWTGSRQRNGAALREGGTKFRLTEGSMLQYTNKKDIK